MAKLPGSELTVECFTTGKPKPTLHWYKDGVLLTEETNEYLNLQNMSGDSNVTSILTITSLMLSHEGRYECIAWNVLPNGTVSDSSSLNITVMCELISSFLKKYLSQSLLKFLAIEQNFTGIAISSTEIFLTWTIVPGLVTHKYFVVNCVELETKREWNFFAVETHARIISLHPYYSYSCKLQVVGNVSYPFSYPIIIQTHQASMNTQ